jgi:hypothetical protein
MVSTMIDQVDEDLIRWVEDTLGHGLTPSLSAPADGKAPSVNLYLLELVDDPLRHSSSKLPYQPALRYLVSTHAADPREAHRLLSKLLYAALESAQYEVDLDPIPSIIWTAFQITPRPAFILKAPLPHDRKETAAILVRDPVPKMDSSAPIVPLHGLLLGPGEVPLMNARIELPNLYISATTDRKGRFTLPGVPAAPSKKTLLIKARRKEKTEVVQQTGTPDQPVIIHFDLFKSEGGK